MAKKKELDTELNLISFISLLSVLICALLLTAVWVQIGSMNVKQAVGGQAASGSSKKTPSAWAQLAPDGSVQFILKDIPRKAKALDNRRIKGIEGEIDMDSIEAYIEALKSAVPGLKTILIQPKAETIYDKIIRLMDGFKKGGFVDLGIVPL
ncbi:MAG: biopolymer transporter ExbD [Bacteriovoracales bacterium]|nr:biopolymer transporter ExbD [Bacteriovoracales bacterium]